MGKVAQKAPKQGQKQPIKGRKSLHVAAPQALPEAVASETSGMLHVVGTPIGNLGDLSPRVEQALRQAQLLACEDTRRTGLLLQKLGVPHRTAGGPTLVSYHEHNEAGRTAELVRALQAGQQVVLVSDSGLPGISDPGARLVAAARAAGVGVTVIPGPCAALVALVGTGLAGTFSFVGFLPRKLGARTAVLAGLLARNEHGVLYESPQRVVKTLHELAALAPTRTVWLARELTKMHEEWVHGTPQALAEQLQKRAGGVKGECVLVVAAA
jgi:16S rRNA (cytidine1402-2'-O)-methyltransferase